MAENTVNQSTLESLSALVDNEASELELHRLLKQSESSAEVRETWARYQMASAAMRGDVASGSYVDLSAAISAAISEEPAHAVNDESPIQAKAQRRWWQAAGRFAVAASVAGAVVLGAQQYQAQLLGGARDAEVAEASTASQSVPLPAGFTAPSFNTRTVSSHDRYAPNPGMAESRKVLIVPRQGENSLPDAASKREIQNHLNQLMLEHAEHAALNSGRGMLPFARVARMEEE